MLKRSDLEKLIIILCNKDELNEILNIFEIKTLIKHKKFPMILYQGMYESISISEISEENLEKLKMEKLETKSVWYYSNIDKWFYYSNDKD